METISFKFKWLDSEGNEQGFFAKKGSFDGETLRLDNAEIHDLLLLLPAGRVRILFSADVAVSCL